MDTKTSNLLVVQLNGEAVLEYNREQSLSKLQQDSLVQLENKLSQGISLGGQFINCPTLEQQIQFVAANLISALIDENEGIAALSCAYIAAKLDELKQIKAIEKNGQVSIELIFDRDYQEEFKMNFMSFDKITSREH